MTEATGTVGPQSSASDRGSAGAGRSVRLKSIGTRRKVLGVCRIGRAGLDLGVYLEFEKVPIANPGSA